MTAESPLWCANDAPHAEHWEHPGRGDRGNYCSGRPTLVVTDSTTDLIAEARSWVADPKPEPGEVVPALEFIDLVGRLADALEGERGNIQALAKWVGVDEATDSLGIACEVSAVLEAATPCVVTTISELDALPRGVIVVRAWGGNLDPDLWLRVTGGWRDLFDRNDDDVYYSSFIWSESATFTVLWVGGTE